MGSMRYSPNKQALLDLLPAAGAGAGISANGAQQMPSDGKPEHELPYTVVPLTDGLMRIETPDGWIDFPIAAGAPYSRPAGVEHDVHNGGDTEIRFIEVEARQVP